MYKFLAIFVLMLACVLLCSFNQAINLNSWKCQLQNYSFSKLLEINNRILVLDQFKDYQKPFTKKELTKFQQNGNLIFSYLSIGEAEGYRDYFNSMDKNLLISENINWKDNFLVKFWSPKWQKIILGDQNTDGVLIKIINTGFDGVYLDLVDVFERFENKKEKAQQMSQFIQKISQKAKAQNSDFKIIIQNGIEIINYLDKPQKLIDSIDGISLEDVFFYGNSNSFNRRRHLMKLVERYQKYNKIVLSLEYIEQSHPQREKYLSFAQKYKLIPQTATKLLDK